MREGRGNYFWLYSCTWDLGKRHLSLDWLPAHVHKVIDDCLHEMQKTYIMSPLMPLMQFCIISRSFLSYLLDWLGIVKVTSTSWSLFSPVPTQEQYSLKTSCLLCMEMYKSEVQIHLKGCDVEPFKERGHNDPGLSDRNHFYLFVNRKDQFSHCHTLPEKVHHEVLRICFLCCHQWLHSCGWHSQSDGEVSEVPVCRQVVAGPEDARVRFKVAKVEMTRWLTRGQWSR